MDETEGQVIAAICSVKNITDPPRTALLREGLGIDSMQFVRIIARLTDKLGVNIFELSDQELSNVKTVDDLIELFRK